MKKTRNVYLLVGLLVTAAVSLILIFFFTQEKSRSVEAVESTESEDYLLQHGLEKAPDAESLIFLCEKRDCSFTYTAKDLKNATKEISESFFDGVILKSESLSNKNTAVLSDSEKEKLSLICKYFSSKDKKAYVYCTAYLSADSVNEICTFADGVVLDLQAIQAQQKDKLNSKLSEISKRVNKNKISLIFGKNTEYINEIDKKYFSNAFVNLNSESDVELFKRLQLEFNESESRISPLTDFSLYGESLMSVEGLKAHYAIRENGNIGKRAFFSYSDAKENKDNCYSALKAYFVRGISPILAFRELKIKNYDERDIPKLSETVFKVKLSGSYLFPIYVNGKSIGALPKGVGEVSLDLVIGENSFTFEQNGNSAVCKAEFVFDGDIVKSVAPSKQLKVSPGEEVVIMAVAYSEADVSVRLGTKTYTAQKQDDSKGYTAFYAKIKMPTDISELFSLGSFSVVANLGEKMQKLEGAVIVPVELVNSPVFTSSLQSDVTYGVQNYNPTYSSAQQDILPSISAAVSKATTNSYYTAYTGNQTAVVVSDYAETIPSSQSDYVPYFTPLAKGTKDFVIGESQVFDEDEGDWHYYYELASGMKVVRDSVVLEPSTDMPENTLTVNSVYGSDGEITIRLGTSWKIPYTMNIIDQSYFSSNSRPYYVSQFNATAFSLTFSYTTATNGKIDCSSSEIVSDAVWTFSAENKTATLYFPLRQSGVYYGYSLTYEGDEMVITIKNKPKGLAGSVVVLDPGHGADDSGATGLSGSVKESDINILIAYQVKDALQQQGVTVYMTRYADDDINLEGRKIFARTVKPDLFVSIHSNASSTSSSIGTSAFYYKPFSVDLATNIYDEIVSVYKNYLYAGRQELYSEISRGVKYYPFSVTRLDECPSVLIEVGFMTNDEECYMLTQSQNQQLIGQAIAVGICNTLTQ